MRKIVKLTAAACLLTAAVAGAQEAPSTQPAPRKAGATEHVERAGAELKEAGKAASDEAREAARVASEQAGETMREAREGAGDALEQARKQAASSAQQAERAAKEASEQARTGLEKARVKAVSFFDEAREQVRRALLDAADSLESDARKEEREKARSQRQDVARLEQWRSLRDQLDATGAAAPNQAEPVKPALSEELRVHAQRVARLARIRALADQAKDQASVARCDTLLAQELARHEQEMKSLLTKDQAEAARDGQAPKESQP